MMRLILNGAGGRMGAVVRDLLAERGAELFARAVGPVFLSLAAED